MLPITNNKQDPTQDKTDNEMDSDSFSTSFTKNKSFNISEPTKLVLPASYPSAQASSDSFKVLLNENNDINSRKTEDLSSLRASNNSSLKKYFLNHKEVVIHIEGFAFNPSELFVHIGTKITWEIKAHNSGYNSLYNQSGPRFFIISIPQMVEESDPLHENESFSVIMADTGSFNMNCANYTRIKGKLIVVDKSVSLAELIEDQKEQQTSETFQMSKIDGFKYATTKTKTREKQEIEAERKSQPRSSSIVAAAVPGVFGHLRDQFSIIESSEKYLNQLKGKENDQEMKNEGKGMEKDFVLELEREQQYQKGSSGKRKNHHYLQLYKEDCKEEQENEENSEEEQFEQKQQIFADLKIIRLDDYFKDVGFKNDNNIWKIILEKHDYYLGSNLLFCFFSFRNDELFDRTYGQFESNGETKDLFENLKLNEFNNQKEDNSHGEKIQDNTNGQCNSISKQENEDNQPQALESDREVLLNVEKEKTEDNLDEGEEYLENDSSKQQYAVEAEEDTQYDCNTIISEEDQQSVHTSKESSFIQRMSNSTNIIHSPTDYDDEDDYDEDCDGSASCRSFTALACSDRRFPKSMGTKKHHNQSFSRHQIFRSSTSTLSSRKKKNTIGLFAENTYLKSPAQSILTTAESSKYSDTTKQPSQKGDFDMETADIRGGLQFQNKYNYKRRASTDQIQESRYHNLNNGLDDSDTRSIKSLKNEPLSQANASSSHGSSENQQQYSGNGVSAESLNIPQNTVQMAESDNENECKDIFMNYDINKFKKNAQLSSRSKSRETQDDLQGEGDKDSVSFNHTNLQNFLKQQSLSNQEISGRLSNKERFININSNRQDLSSNGSEQSPYPLLIANGKPNKELIESENKILENLNLNKYAQVLDASKFQDEIDFVQSFLQQRYEVESWLLDLQEESEDTAETKRVKRES